MNRRVIYILLIIIIVSAGILLYKINTEPKYDQEIYDEIYAEYDKMLAGIQINSDPVTDIYSLYDDYVQEEKKSNVNRYKILGDINIPKIGITYPIIATTTDEYLKIAPTKYAGPYPNQVGNLCIVAHNYRNGTHFGNLKKLNNNDTVIIGNISGTRQEYIVYDKFEVDARDFSCTTQNTNGKKELTLITCTSSKSKRLVVKCIAN